ncbi:alpha/beta fold hydrolase, partial [Actinomadura geliboluensis]
DLEGDDQLEALVDAQLVECSGTDATGRMRYRLHDLVRLYALERTEVEDAEHERDAALERVLDGYRERAERVAASRWPQDWHRRAGEAPVSEYSALDWLTSERPALLALLAQGAEHEMWSLVWRLGRATCSLFHSLRVFWPEWRAAAELTYTVATHMDDDQAVGIALLERSSVQGNQGFMESAYNDASEALRIFTGGREMWWRARALRAAGMCLRDAGNLDEGQGYLIEAIDAFAEEMYLKIGRALGERGYTVLLFDGPGQGEARRRGVHARHDSEVPVAAAVDFLQRRDGVDPDRIGLIGSSLGGYYATRAAAFEHRLRACVVWGASEGIDAAKLAPGGPLAGRARQVQALFGLDDPAGLPARVAGFHLRGVPERIRCPVLILHGESDVLVPLEVAHRTFDAVGHEDKRLITYPPGTPGCTHCQLDALSVAHRDICDWLDTRLRA